MQTSSCIHVIADQCDFYAKVLLLFHFSKHSCVDFTSEYHISSFYHYKPLTFTDMKSPVLLASPLTLWRGGGGEASELSHGFPFSIHDKHIAVRRGAEVQVVIQSFDVSVERHRHGV